jgi:hypothetical protein
MGLRTHMCLLNGWFGAAKVHGRWGQQQLAGVRRGLAEPVEPLDVLTYSLQVGPGLLCLS